MNAIFIEIGGKKYSTMKITAWLSKEAIRINRDELAMGKRAMAIKESELDISAAEELQNVQLELSDRKSALLCEAYGGKFTVDELERAFTSEELTAEFMKVFFGVADVLAKN